MKLTKMVKVTGVVAGRAVSKTVDLALIGVCVTILFDFVCLTASLIRGNK